MSAALGIGAAVLVGGPLVGGAVAGALYYSKKDKKPKAGASNEESKDESNPSEEQATAGE